jgi:hypothetical protein
MALGSTMTEMSTMNLPADKERPARKADHLTALFEPIVYKIWETQRFTTLWASTVCYRNSYNFSFTAQAFSCYWYLLMPTGIK